MILLGSTGSIGCSALSVAQSFGTKIETLVAGKNITLLNTQIARFSPRYVAIADAQDLPKLQSKGAKVFCGSEGILEAIDHSSSDLVLNALVGFAGLEPSLASIRAGKKLALANKESLVCGGWLIDTQKIVPVDSEHFSLWHLLQTRPFKKLIITASGGAFRDLDPSTIPQQDAQNALKHPNWKMGAKITVDSASMANKIFEILEAYWLFGTTEIEARIERQSIIHGIVEFRDGSVGMHLAKPDMKLAISYAINPTLASQSSLIPPLSLDTLCSFELETIDPIRYPLWELKETLLAEPRLGVILNASNEVAIQGFLEGKYRFGRMLEIIFESMQRFSSLPQLTNLSEIKELDQEVRDFSSSLI